MKFSGASNGNWKLFSQRNLFVWEREQVEELKLRLQGVLLHSSKTDCQQWRGISDNTFTVISVYDRWELQSNPNYLRLSLIWENLCPTAVEIFTWMTIQDRIATHSDLQSRNIIARDDALQQLCPFCSLELENPQHIVLHRSFSWRIRSKIME